MKVHKTVQRACRVLRANVRLRRVKLCLPGSVADDTPRIRETIRIYTETWIIPILDAIETGDMMALRSLMGSDLEEGIDTGWDGEKR